MVRLEFGTCMGEKVDNPGIIEIIKLIEEHDIGYWECGSGQSVFKFIDIKINKEAELYLSAAEQYGYYLEYYSNNKYYVILSEGAFTDIANVYIGGEPIQIPSVMFINKKDTIKQIKKFLETGEVDQECCRWVEKESLKWDYGMNGQECSDSDYQSIEELIRSKSKIKRRWMK